MKRTSSATLPAHVTPPAKDKYPWWQFPIGITHGGKVVTMDLTDERGHTLVVGDSGSGASVLQSTMLRHVAHHMGRWDVIAIDLLARGSGMNEYRENLVLREHFRVVGELEEAVTVLKNVRNLVRWRYELMQYRNLRSFSSLVEKRETRAQFLLIEELYHLVARNGNKSEKGLHEDSLRLEATALICEIARLGKAVRVHLVVGTHPSRLVSPDIPRHLLTYFDNEILLGGAVLSGVEGVAGTVTVPAKPRGHGWLRVDNFKPTEVQTYYTKVSDFPQV